MRATSSDRAPKAVTDEERRIGDRLVEAGFRPAVRTVADRVRQAYDDGSRPSAEAMRASPDFVLLVDELLRDPDLARVCHRASLENDLLAGLGYEGLPAGRFRELLTVPGPVIYVLEDETAVERMRSQLGPRQVWLRYDLVARDHLSLVATWASFQMTGKGWGSRSPGRKPGSRNEKLRRFVLHLAELGPHTLTTDEVFELACAEELRDSPGPLGPTEADKRWCREKRHAAVRLMTAT